MKASHSSKLMFKALTILILSAMLLFADEPPAEVSDVNDPWSEWTKDFSFSWDSIDVSTKMYKAPVDAEEPLEVKSPYRTLRVGAKVDRNKSATSISLDTTHPVVTRVLDIDHNEISLPPVLSSTYLPSASLKHTYPTASKDSFTLDIPLPNNTPLPSSLSLVEAHIFSLYAWELIDINVPLEVSDDWIPVGNGFQVRVWQVNESGGVLNFETEIKSLIGSTLPLSNPYLVCSTNQLADFIVIGAKLSKALNPIVSWDPRLGVPANITCESSDTRTLIYCPAYGPQSNDTSVRCSGSYIPTSPWPAYLPNTNEKLTIRYTIAIAPYEVKIPFTLTDITIPTLDHIYSGIAPEAPTSDGRRR